jgi:Zn-dependent protease with chaperone function
MMTPNELKAYMYDGATADRKSVTVKLTLPGYLVVQELGALARFRWEDVVVEDRLGSQPARVSLPSGARLEIGDSESFFAGYAISAGRKQWLHAIEARWSLVLGALAITLAIAWLVYAFGIPVAARTIAYSLPASVDEVIGAEGLTLLDQHMFQPSELTAQRQQELQLVFADVVATVGDDRNYQLEFRASESVGSNAFALPAGIVVITDDLVELAQHDDELAAVLAHEVGHVRNRHALRKLLQNSIVAGGMVLITGDIASAGNLAAGIPVLLANANYSREFELDADAVAREYLLERQIPLRRFAEFIVRLDEQNEASSSGANLLSSHPAALERAENFR